MRVREKCISVTNVSFRVGATLAVVPFPVLSGRVGCRKGSPYARVSIKAYYG